MNEKLSGNLEELNKAFLDAQIKGRAYLRINSDGSFTFIPEIIETVVTNGTLESPKESN